MSPVVAAEDPRDKRPLSPIHFTQLNLRDVHHFIDELENQDHRGLGNLIKQSRNVFIMHHNTAPR